MTKNYLCRAPYLRNRTSWLSFMVQMCKMMVPQGIFSMIKLWFFRLSRGWKGKKWPKMSKIYVCCTLYFKNHTSYDLYLWYTCMHKRIISRHFFSFFSKFWYSRSLGGELNGQKMVQNDKIFCLSHSVPQEPYIIWLWFLVHMCKMMIPPVNFFIFQNFNFCGF